MQSHRLLLLLPLLANVAPGASADHCGSDREWVCWEHYENNGEGTTYRLATDGCHPLITDPCVPNARLEEEKTYYERQDTRYTYHIEPLCDVTSRCAGTYDTGASPF